MPANTSDDVIVIGGGHNGLVCAFYLAKAGAKVTVLERGEQVGGAAITEEFHPGFKNSVASYTVSLLNPKVITDMDLHRHGLKILERKVNNFWPHQHNGKHDFLAFAVGFEHLKKEIARYSQHDADNLERYFADIELVANLIRDQLLKTPPNAGGGLKDVLKLIALGNRTRKLTTEQKTVLMDIFTKSVADFLSLYFENEFVKGAFAFDGIVGTYASPHTPGTAYVLMHHAFGEVNGKQGVWGHAVGGMGAITQAMQKACQQQGVKIVLKAEVGKVLSANSYATGVQLSDGQQIMARTLAANVNPSLLFDKLVDESDLPETFTRRIKHYKNASGTFRMNVALDKLPSFSCLQEQDRASAEHLTGGIVIGPTLDYLDQAYLDARQHGWSQNPVVEMLIPSTLDDSLAPPGQHVASLFCQQFEPEVDGDINNWDTHRDAAVETILNTVEAHAPGFKASIVGMQVLSPLDLERKIGLTKGDIMHGVLSLDQM
ncbi:MAG: NAD(P)/FAD-dependent oxidoreductase, partial [Gammaproteobacteria bacterium]|nr:NAD(P)/FAD-dependent oxidoreductase [Gammaproteobacteria bacterium]